MKLLSSYKKELLIASRGFYFYIEIISALIVLALLLFGVPEHPNSASKEFLLFDMPTEALRLQEATDLAEGTLRIGETKEWVLKPAEFTLTNKESNDSITYTFTEEKTIQTRTLENIDPTTGRVKRIVYEVAELEDLYRLAYQERTMSGVMSLSSFGELSYQYILQGYETERLVDTLYILHNEDMLTLQSAVMSQPVRTLGVIEQLNTRENQIPIFLTFAGSLMGFFIVVAYIFLDKAEGVIRAFAVSPASIRGYLISKIMVICTTVIISSSLIVIPVMGAGPNYPLLYLFLIVSTAAFAALGLFISSYFESMNTSFGTLYGVMIALMVPALAYYIPSFDPFWLRLFPTAPVLQVYKDLLLNTQNLRFTWIFLGVFLAGAIVLLELARWRFKKTLTL